MKKNIYILNHYATDMYFNEGGRHLWFAQKLKENGYNPIVFCASTTHNSNKEYFQEEHYKIKYFESIPFVFIKCAKYNTNGFSRINNMFDFYRGIISLRKIDLGIPNPDVIYASSVHPLTLVAGIRLAKFFGVECISEVRDLWPESIVAYSRLTKKNPVIRLLYQGEKWIYKKSDKVIMTWEGGYDYVLDQGWNNLPASKFFHINNGVILKDFDSNIERNVYKDKILSDKNYINIVYTGSIRKVNNLDFILDVAKKLSQENNKIRFLMYGSGDEVSKIKKRINDENIFNALYMGKVEKKYIPSILSQATINLLHNQSTILDKYGQSQNKLFEYLAAGKPILQTYTTNYSVIEKYSCGEMCEKQEIEQVIFNLKKIVNSSDMIEMGNNARDAVLQYDYDLLTQKLINIIENKKMEIIDYDTI
ncbi:glycosyltransferase family 4 protein [Enterococcus mundtii]|uniref:glycosyltransferase family 4 protein n=1 Tax=Enterococcus mundtii TaxID=53346 RepID=UPI002DB6F47B|nr:glycosyltransferase family 4 protein [Enterococcus mundtii]MEC3940320.1 glycosyltransferase family 4 protein [Enterococcus mundtii]